MQNSVQRQNAAILSIYEYIIHKGELGREMQRRLLNTEIILDYLVHLM